jgi:peptide/nickel transport system permease protein
MTRYLLRRLSYSLAIVAAVTVIVSSIIYLAPVDPARLTFGQRSDAGAIEKKQRELGLDQPLYVQLGWYLNDLSPLSLYTDTRKNALRYDYYRLLPLGEKVLVVKWPYLRQSFQTGERVSAMLARAVPKTALLALTAILLATFLGIFLGVMAAIRHDTWIDRAAVAVSVLGYSIPSYVAAILLALLFGYYWHSWTGLPVQGGLTEISISGANFGEEVVVWKNLVLPALALGIRPVAIITQLTRSAMLDVLNEDFVRTAFAKGLPRRIVFFRHALRNALNPIVTTVSGWFASLLAGAFFVENVFSFKGLGEMTVTALLNFDIPVVLGGVIFTAIAFVGINILADVLYAALNPKVRL